MSPAQPAEGQGGTQAIDPISRQILQRTVTQHKIPQTSSHAPASSTSGPQDEDPEPQGADPESLRRTDTGFSSKAPKDKKNRVSFLSRIMGTKKKDESIEVRDTVSEITDLRWGGNDAEVFSQPVGFIPKFPAPPRYIRVKAQNRKKRDLDRLFLSQILLDPQPLRSRRRSTELDAKIVGIEDTPTAPPPNSSRKLNNATWAAEFSKDGKYFAAAGQDKKLRVWEVLSSKEARDAEEELSEPGSEEHVKLNAPVFKQRLIREYDGHTAAILDLSWSKNNFLLSSSMDKTVRLYHVSRDECLCSFKHNDFVTSIQFHPRDDRFFLAGSLDSKLRLWSIPDKSVAYWAQVPDMVTAVAFTPDGKTAIAGCLSGVCILYNTEGLKAHSQIHVRSTRGRNTKGSKITGIDTISVPHEHRPADVKLLITSNDSRVRMYNLKDRALEMKFRGNENACSQIRASFSDDGRFVICGSEDRKVYVWPTGPVEKADTDKRPVEVFEAHSQIVTTALFAPASTRRVLGRSGDPIYDLCNPPPVVLLSRTDSMLSSPAHTNRSGQSDEHLKNANTAEQGELSQKASESPAYQARQSHMTGHIIVTADYSGQIKVFRGDCAYQKRRDSTWDSGSTLSRKLTMLGRSNSGTPRTSIASSNRRNSLNLPSKTPSTDRILNWRNSVSSSPNPMGSNLSEFGFSRANTERDRSSSPRKSLSNRLSLRYSGTPISNTATSSPSKSNNSPATPDFTLQSPDSAHSHPYDPSSENAKATSPPTHSMPYVSTTQPYRTPTQLSPVGEASPLTPTNHSTKSPHSTLSNPLKSAELNPMILVDDHSYEAWDVQNTLVPMLQANPRTPGSSLSATGDRNPISRTQSLVSRLSSEVGSSDVSENADAEPNSTMSRQRIGRNASTGTATGGDTDDEELRCKVCASEKFRVVKVSGGGRRLKCRSCDTVI